MITAQQAKVAAHLMGTTTPQTSREIADAVPGVSDRTVRLHLASWIAQGLVDSTETQPRLYFWIGNEKSTEELKLRTAIQAFAR